MIRNRTVLLIADGCNALELFLLYGAFLLCYPRRGKLRTGTYIAGGTIAIFILNILRCLALTMLNIKAPEYSHFAHHYAFTVIVYLFIFYGWMSYVRDGSGTG